MNNRLSLIPKRMRAYQRRLWEDVSVAVPVSSQFRQWDLAVSCPLTKPSRGDGFWGWSVTPLVLLHAVRMCICPLLAVGHCVHVWLKWDGSKFNGDQWRKNEVTSDIVSDFIWFSDGVDGWNLEARGFGYATQSKLEKNETLQLFSPFYFIFFVINCYVWTNMHYLLGIFWVSIVTESSVVFFHRSSCSSVLPRIVGHW